MFSIGNEKEGTANPTRTSINKNEEIHKLKKNPSMPKFNSDFYLKKNNNNQNYTLIIDGEEVQLTEINLGVTKEDAESYYAFINLLNQDKTRFKEKFLNFFSKRKIKLLYEPENTDCTKKETNSKSFKDSLKINSINNHIDLQNTVNCSKHENTVTIEDKSTEK